MIPTLLFAALVSMQEPGLQALVERLGDESPVVREESATALIRRCNEAAPLLLQSLPGAEGDRWKLIDLVLQKCHAEIRRRAIAIPPAKVSFSANQQPVSAALADLGKVLGISMPVLQGRDQPITVDIKERHPLEALDLFCKQAGLTWYALWKRANPPPDAMPVMEFHAARGAPAVRDALYVKNVRVGFGGMAINRTRTPFKDDVQVTVGGMIQSSPLMGHVDVEEVVVKKVVDDRGNVLYEPPAPKPDAPRRPPVHRFGVAPPGTHAPWHLSIKPPDPEAKTISILGGSAAIRGEIGRRHVSFGASEKAVGQTVDFENQTYELSSIRTIGGKMFFGVTVEGRRQPVDASATCRIVGEHRPEQAELRLQDGSVISLEGMPMHGRSARERATTVEFAFPATAAPVEFRIIVYTLWAMETVEFEFKDIPIPN
jgi:hypothetical protein